FAFQAYSKEPTAGAPVTTTGAAAPPAAGGAAPAPAPNPPATARNESPAAAATPPAVATPAAPPAAAAPAGATSSSVDPGLIPLPIPDSVPEMLTQLSQRTEQIKRFIDQGAFANVYVPAFQAKDLALAIDERKKEIPAEHLKTVEPAIKRLV